MEPDKKRRYVEDVYRRILLGTAVGDSLGLPAEGLSRATIARRWKNKWRQRLIFGHSMISDDTEHTVFVSQCLCQHAADVERFRRGLAKRLRWWLVCLPPGIGLATARSIVKLWLGISPARSGVFSAGNGPAMRSAIIGAYFWNKEERIKSFVRASTRITHSDPKAETAALAVAVAASKILQTRADEELDFDGLFSSWRSCGTRDPDWQKIVDHMERAHSKGDSVQEFAAEMGLENGVSGYSYHSVPVALFGWIRHRGDFERSLTAVLDCGGDTDSVGAVCGALAALEAPIPEAWLNGLSDWPISVSYLNGLAGRVAGRTFAPSPLRWAIYPLRNVFLLCVVLVHGLRRLLP